MLWGRPQGSLIKQRYILCALNSIKYYIRIKHWYHSFLCWSSLLWFNVSPIKITSRITNDDKGVILTQWTRTALSLNNKRRQRSNSHAMNKNSTESESDEKLSRCNGSFLTFYWSDPAQGAHLYSNIAYIVANSFLSILGVFLNALVITVYAKNKTLRTSCNMLFVALASSDLMVTSIVQPLLVVRMVQEIFGTHNCTMWMVARLMSYFCCGVSLLTIAIISVERFITLAYPYRYQTILTPLRLKIAVASTWVTILVFVSLHLGPVSFALLSSVGVMLIISTILTVISIWVWIQRLVRRHQQTIASTQMPADIETEANRLRRNIFRTTNTCYLIVGSVLGLYFPSIVLLLYTAIHDNSFVALFLISPWAETIMFANSVLNPVLLFWRKRVFRDVAMGFLFNIKQDEELGISRSMQFK